MKKVLFIILIAMVFINTNCKKITLMYHHLPLLTRNLYSLVLIKPIRYW